MAEVPRNTLLQACMWILFWAALFPFGGCVDAHKKDGPGREYIRGSLSSQSAGISGAPVLARQRIGSQIPEMYRAASTKAFKNKMDSDVQVTTPQAISGKALTTKKDEAVRVADSEVASLNYFDPPAKSMLFLSGNHKDLESLTLADILLATDIEGGLHALNRDNGQLLWSIPSDKLSPLLTVSEPTSLNNETLIVEPYGDGNIYYFSTYQGLQKLPVTIKHLVDLSPMDLKTQIIVDELGTTLEDEKIYTGSRTTAIYTIDVFTGDIISVYGPGTEKKAYNTTQVNCTRDSFHNDGCENILVIGKTIYELGIHTKDNTVYNVTYAQWQHNSIDNYLASKNRKSQDGIYVAPFRDKSLLAIDSDFKMAKWVSPKFTGIINNVFDIYLDYSTNEKILLPHPLKPPEDTDSSNLQVYLDQTENQSWFALSSEYFPSLVETAPKSKFSVSEKWRNTRIFEDSNLFKAAIYGVHELEHSPFDNFFINDQEYHYDAFLDNNGKLLDPSPNEKLPYNVLDSKSVERYMSPDEILQYKIRLHEQVTRDVLSRGSDTFASLFARFIYRVFESGLVLILSVFLVILLSNFKLIPPVHVLLERGGIIPKQPLVAATVDITESVAVDQREPEQDRSVGSDDAKGTDAEKSDGQGDDETRETEKRKRKRGKRGGKNNKKRPTIVENGQSIRIFENENDLKHLAISDKILGYGSSGTVVFQGSFQHRPVAVKRMLIDFFDVASHEIKLLAESDDHPNVVRYYCSEVTEKFLYIALELCTATLEDVIELKGDSPKFLELQQRINPINVLFQIASGISHLHSMKIVHRDLKPQNILVAPSKAFLHQNQDVSSIRILISDFGLCKKLEAEESSFKTNINNAAGTSGWRAPELLNGKLSILETIESEESSTTQDTAKTTQSSEPLVYDPVTKKRLTRAIDIFSLGCVFYYVLSKGKHPFGDRFVREGNILKGEYSLEDLNKTLRDRSTVLEAKNLIEQMIQYDPLKRPTAHLLLRHPLFWPVPKKLEFLLKVSDRFEIERRDPPSQLLLKLEASSTKVIPNKDWHAKFDQVFMDNLGKYRKYHGEKLMDLLRALRNKYHHFHDLPEELAELMGPIPDGFYYYFIKRFPDLLMEIYYVVKANLRDDQILTEFL
ncbi:ADR293Cp [Eremothecium gossypii ATCC 10895]|uniref:non-specific serine/threonine protein kinase n=1 Tax=Eremothecium gossypii (strain ATCC 10895 / CBS 109.51 / FGSC 9923 / NRRL Y-1056) TaxID=284811 RepID=Q759H2_EREGS|nr:ADR293Cp [Eremothecium gossypii ATCC 10895]AAS52213.2 ADR293Cp [Eremothecium gossypii ATCC 10895]AEY96512.1 FADR293Cp [Eremothecium gossypii FDAG1]